MAKSTQSRAAKSGGESTPQEILTFYRDMLLIRRFEEKAGQLYGMGLIGGFCHLYIGQEAVVVGMQAALEAGRHRHHRLPRPRPHAGLRHGPARRDGRADRPRAAATPRARAARCTCSAARRASTAATASSARQVPLGTGLAFAHKYREDGSVCLCLFRRRRGQPGPGLRELQHGGAVEAAGRLRDREQQLRHGHRGRARRRPAPSCATRGTAYGIPGEQVDGMDVVAVRTPARAALAHVPRSGKGPYHPRDDDLSLSRPLDVRPGEVPHQGRGAEDARAARPDRAPAQGASLEHERRRRGRASRRSTRRSTTSSTTRPSSPRTVAGARSAPSSGPTSWSRPESGAHDRWPMPSILMPALRRP